MEHINGSISCNTFFYSGNWGGCNPARYPPMNTWVTDHQNNIKFPLPEIADTHTPHGFYHLPPYDDNSPKIKFQTSSSYWVYAQAGKEFRVFYGEDLFDLWHSNNGGTHCVKVLVSFFQN